jgi:hypothetical protein
MAELIELMTPLKYAAKGLRFLDYSLDAASVGDNCKRIAESKGEEAWFMMDRHGHRRAPTPNEVLVASTVALIDLGRVRTSHRDYMAGLQGAKP